MTYSCTDFVDTILDALGIEVPEEDWDDPSAQADLALEAIESLKNRIDPAQAVPRAKRFAVFVTQADGRGTTHIDTYDADSADEATAAALEQVSADWGWDKANLRVLGVLDGPIKVLRWDDLDG